MGILVGFVLVALPLQHSFPLSRYQHYSLGLFAMAVGLGGQSLLEWRKASIWAKSSLLGSASFLVFFSSYIWCNPWLGNPDLATEQQLGGRFAVLVILVAAIIPLAVCWRKWWIELLSEAKPASEQNKSEPPLSKST